MGRYVIRASPDEARYGVISTIVDNFVWVNGTREETLEYLVNDFRPGTDRLERERADAENRLAKADMQGSDSFIGNGWWDDETIIIMNNDPCGRLPRDKVGEFMRRIEAEEPTEDLLLPFEDL
jgi:hypothetical protein